MKPFFEAAAGVSPPARRMLLISFHFPPGDAAGALRWQKLAAFARARGWALDVLTLHPDHLPKPDLHRLDDLPPDTRVYGIPMPKRWVARVEHALWKLYRRLRPRDSGAQATAATNHAQPALPIPAVSEQRSIPARLRRAYDAWMYYNEHATWTRAAVQAGEAVVATARPDLIVSCGPPHLAHEGGRQLSQNTGAPLVVDMRDPWQLVERLADPIDSKLWYWLARYYERRVIDHAALVVMNTEPARRAMQKLYPEKANRMIAVRNGYDDELLPSSRHGATFTIAYAGTVYLDRDPRVVFEAAAEVIKALQLTPADIGIELMGHIDGPGGPSMESFAGRMGIAPYVRALPPGSRSAAMDFLSSATMLLNLPQDSNMAIPSKLYEYVCFDAWLLALAQKGSATEMLLRDSGADVVEPNDREGIRRVLTERYQQFRAGKRPVRLSANNDSFSRREQARVLFDAVDQVLGAR